MRSSNFFRNTLIFLLGSGFSKMISFLLLPLYTVVLPPEDMGYFDLSITYVAIACEVLFLDIWVVVMRFMYREDVTHEKSLSAGITLFGFSTILLLAVSLIFYVAVGPKYFWLVIAYGWTQNMANLFAYVARGKGHNVDFALSGLVCSAVLAISNLILLLGFSFDFSALYISAALGFTVQCLFLEWRVGILRELSVASFKAVQKKFLYSMLKFGIPIGLNAVTYWFINSFNRVAIERELSLSENGIFAIGVKFASLVVFVTSAANFAWQDVAFRQTSEDKSTFRRYSTGYFVVVMLGMAVLLPVVNLLFPLFVGEQYSAAKEIAPFALIAAGLSGYSNFLVNIFYALDKSKQTFWAIAIACVTNLSLVFPALRTFGLQGANISAICGWVAAIAFMHLYLGAKFQIYPHVAMCSVAAVAPIASCFVYFHGAPVWNICLGAVLFFLLVGILLNQLGVLRRFPGVEKLLKFRRR